MAKKNKGDSQINLIPQKGFETSEGGRILLWILSSFRIVVIVTEIVVMVAFLIRFGLYTKNSDLTKQLKSDQDSIVAESEFENNFRNTQTKLKIYSDIESRNKLSGYLNKVASILPSDIILQSITSDNKNITITGLSPSEISIQQYLVNLQSIPELAKVTLQGINPSPESTSLMSFSMTIPL